MNTAQRVQFHDWSTMALDVFSIFAISSEAECVFSCTKHTLIDERASIHILKIMSELLKNISGYFFFSFLHIRVLL